MPVGRHVPAARPTAAAGSSTEEARQVCIRQAIVAGGFDWVDLETDVADTIRRFGAVKRIVSYHNMQETPPDLEEHLRADAEAGRGRLQDRRHGRNTAADVARVIKLQRDAPKPTVAFCMGEIGIASRFLSLKFGAPWIYAAFNKERGIAPGMPGSRSSARSIRFGRSTRRRKFYGVVGDPVVAQPQPGAAQPHVPPAARERLLPAVPRAAGKFEEHV